jgi:hypothetical protein
MYSRNNFWGRGIWKGGREKGKPQKKFSSPEKPYLYRDLN